MCFMTKKTPAPFLLPNIGICRESPRKLTLLPAPGFVFRWEGPSKSIQVISWEDWLDGDSPEVKQKFETIEGKDRIERKLLKVELNQRLLDYLKEWERFAKGG